MRMIAAGSKGVSSEGLSCRGIAERLGRCPSAVSGEVCRNRLCGRSEALRAREGACTEPLPAWPAQAGGGAGRC